MRMSLLSDADTPGAFRHVPLAWEEQNTIEAIASALGGDVWHGREFEHLFLEALRAYDVVLINLKHTLLPVVPQLVSECAGRVIVAGYQEGPSDLAGRLDHREIEPYRRAVKAVDHLFVFDPLAVDWFMGMRDDARVSHLPIPAPVKTHARFRVAVEKRPENPPRICTCQPMSHRRGAYFSLQLGCRLGARVIAAGQTDPEAEVVSKLIAAEGGRPYTFGWRSWEKKGRRDGQEPFLGELGACRLAANLDTAACYGRFVVDCALLDVPCIGSNRVVMQRALFPELAFDPYQEFRAALECARHLLEDPEAGQEFCRRARRALAKQTPAATREAFENGLTGLLAPEEVSCVS